MAMVTVRTYKDNGPYFDPTVMTYQVSCLKDIVFHTRLAMNDGEDYISIWHDDYCVGVWEKDAEPVFDESIQWFAPSEYYLLRRPGGPIAGHYNSIAALMR